MPPYKDKLSAAEITGLVKYIRTLGGASKPKKKKADRFSMESRQGRRRLPILSPSAGNLSQD